jgi:hypothetical protein
MWPTSVTKHDQIIGNASALFAWQLVSVSGMGIPFQGHPCSDSDPFEMTCIVFDMLSVANKNAYNQQLQLFGLDPAIVDAIISPRAGCGADKDTSIASMAIPHYIDGLVTALTSSTVADDQLLTFCNSFQPYNMKTLLGNTSIPGLNLRSSQFRSAR